MYLKISSMSGDIVLKPCVIVFSCLFHLIICTLNMLSDAIFFAIYWMIKYFLLLPKKIYLRQIFRVLLYLASDVFDTSSKCLCWLGKVQNML